MPVLGDALTIGANVNKGFDKLHNKYGVIIIFLNKVTFLYQSNFFRYGKIFGCWLGPLETVVVNDFDLIQEVGAREALIARPEFDFFADIRGGYVS